MNHRPKLNVDIPSPPEMCRNLDYKYIEGDFERTIGCKVDCDDIVYLLCGAGLLADEFIKAHRIINAHPGYIPLARGLNSYKWSFYYGLPIGVTTHIIGEHVDAGEIIEQRKINVSSFDTFLSIAQLVYENEIDMLVGAIPKINEEHRYVVPSEGSDIFKRMPADKEKELFERFNRNYLKSINTEI